MGRGAWRARCRVRRERAASTHSTCSASGCAGARAHAQGARFASALWVARALRVEAQRTAATLAEPTSSQHLLQTARPSSYLHGQPRTGAGLQALSYLQAVKLTRSGMRAPSKTRALSAAAECAQTRRPPLTCRLSPSRFSESQCCCRRLRHSVLSAERRSTISLSRTRI